MSFFRILLLVVLFSACATPQTSYQRGWPKKESIKMSQNDDSYLWLEEVESTKALDWVKSFNQKTTAELEQDPRYKTVEAELNKVFLSQDRIPFPSDYANGEIYNFWQDAAAVRGIWRKTSLEEYKKPNPKWETILDVDAFAKQENENWVWKGVDCSPNHARCLIRLSRGGKDASVVREFDLKSKTFLKDGFILDEAKSRISWLGNDAVLVGTDFGAGSLTTSGYPNTIKLWKRGTALATAKTVFKGKKEDVSAAGYSMFDGKKHQGFIHRGITFYTSESLWVSLEGDTKKIDLPEDIDLQGIQGNQLLVSFRKDFSYQGKQLKSGSLVAFEFFEGDLGRAEVLFEPTNSKALFQTSVTNDAVYVVYIEDVKARMLRFTKSDTWKKENISIPDHGSVGVIVGSPYEKLMIYSYESFLVPSSLKLLTSAKDNSAETIKRAPSRFAEDGLEVSQHFVTSKDGTKVPYFQISKKGMNKNGSNPTLLYGYGGFENSMDPFYLNAIGKSWVEKGGVYVIGNIRGGGEYGPKWHQAGLLKNRQKVFDDFISIAEDLVARKVTSPKHLGIRGGSNGGLLVGAVLTQRPDLFGAVICEVPLLDMLRYHKLLAGASWMAEYGNPEDAEMLPFIKAYSPFQNVKAEAKYPRTFFLTSTKDDRVHPGHARKMFAKMKDQGHDVLYFENIEGGHGAAANLKQIVHRGALIYTYLFKQLN